MGSMTPLLPTVVGTVLGGPYGTLGRQATSILLSQAEASRTERARQEDLAREQAEAARRREVFAADQAQERDALARRQTAAVAGAEADASTRVEALTAQSEAAERRRTDALRRAIGEARARLASRGVGGTGGSADALLAGLRRAGADEAAEAEEEDGLRRRSIREDLAALNRRNLLEVTELAERQRLEWLSRTF